MLTFLALQAAPFVTPALVQLLLVIVILGVVLWLVNTYVPMAPPIKTLLTVVVVLLICAALLRMVGLI